MVKVTPHFIATYQDEYEHLVQLKGKFVVSSQDLEKFQAEFEAVINKYRV